MKQISERWPEYLDAHVLLGTIFEQRKQWDEALGVYLKALNLPNLSQRDREYLADRITAIDSR